jgi:hypothetical protein
MSPAPFKGDETWGTKKYSVRESNTRPFPCEGNVIPLDQQSCYVEWQAAIIEQLTNQKETSREMDPRAIFASIFLESSYETSAGIYPGARGEAYEKIHCIEPSEIRRTSTVVQWFSQACQSPCARRGGGIERHTAAPYHVTAPARLGWAGLGWAGPFGPSRRVVQVQTLATSGTHRMTRDRKSRHFACHLTRSRYVTWSRSAESG